MKLLTSTADLLQLVTGAAASVTAHFDWADVTSGNVVTVGRTNTPAIVTATTTTVVGSPAAGFSRNAVQGEIRNTSSTTAPVTLQHTDGTNVAPLISALLLQNESLILSENGVWTHYDANGAPYAYNPAFTANLGATGTLAETIPRQLCPEVNTTVGASGTLFMQAIYLTAGQLVSTIDLWSATTAAGTPTQYNVGLYDANRNLLAQGTNKTTEAWAANSQKSFALTTPYRVPTSGVYYIGFYMVATTVVTLKGGTAKTGGQLAAAAPTLQGTSSTGLSTTLPNPAAAITAGTASIYAAVR